MLFLIFVGQLIFLYNRIYAIDIPYPLYDKADWAAVSYSHLKCPAYNAMYNAEDSKQEINVNIYKPEWKHKIKVKGYLCHKIIYVTRCVKSWYGGTETSQFIIGAPVLRPECLDMISKVNEGFDTINSFFPSKLCLDVDK